MIKCTEFGDGGVAGASEKLLVETKKDASHLRGCETPVDEAIRIGGLDQFFFGTHQGSQSFGQQVGVERLFERFVDTAAVKAHRLSVIGQQSDQDDITKVVVLAQILADLQCLDLADREINDDTIRIKAFRLDASLETTCGNFNLERSFRWKFTLEIFD